MDPTTQAFLAALIGVLVGGGAVLAWHVSDRLQRRLPEEPPPLVPPGVGTVLSVLRSSAVVVGEHDVVHKASAPAYAFGLVRGHELASGELAELVRAVRRDGQIRETEMTVESGPGRPPRTVTARVAPLGSRLVLALVEDRTRERRVEAVRRDFVANVSHELKTPVGAIRLLADRLGEASDDPEAVERFAGRMLTESERLGALVQQIIELSRLQGDDPLEQPESVDVDDVVAGAIDVSAIDAGSRGITVVAGGESGLRVLGNAEQVVAAVGNLVSNAVAYSPSGSTVLVSARPGAPDDADPVGDPGADPTADPAGDPGTDPGTGSGTAGTVDISVTDQGIGIPADEIDRIFERFYRVDPARHRSTGGTGLGLSIVKHVAATHGGEVRVWSVEGQGSTFTLSLPAAAPARRADAARHGVPEPTPPTGPTQQADHQEVRR